LEECNQTNRKLETRRDYWRRLVVENKRTRENHRENIERENRIRTAKMARAR